MNKDFYTLKDSSIAYFFCLVALMVTSIVLSIIVVGISSSNGATPAEVQKYQSVQYINMILSSIIFLFIFIGVNKKYKKNYLVASRLKTKFDYRIVLVAVLLAVIVFLGGLNITGLYNHLFAHIFPAQNTNNVVTTNFGIFIIQVILLALLPAVFEELVFRGIIYNGLRQKFSAGVAIFISAILFMLIHLSIYKSFYQIILGLVLGLLVYYTGSIIYGMIFHFTNNFIILLLNYVAPNGSVFELVKKGELVTASWGATQIILAIVFFILGIGATILVFYLLKKFTFKHKNYFNLEPSPEPLNFKVEEQITLTKDNKVKQQDQGPSHVVWFTMGIAGFVLLWIMMSCGVNL